MQDYRSRNTVQDYQEKHQQIQDNNNNNTMTTSPDTTVVMSYRSKTGRRFSYDATTKQTEWVEDELPLKN